MSEQIVAPKKQRPLTVSITEASEISGFSRHVIETAIRRGELPSLLPHGYVRGRRVRRTDLMRWMDEMEVGA